MSEIRVQAGLGRIRGLLAVALTVALAPGISYCIYSIVEGGKSWLVTSYMTSLMSGWLATVTGVVVGLPMAIWLADRGSAVERRHKAEEDEIFAREMRNRVLHTVSRELTSSVNGLQEMAQGVLTRIHFNVGHWNALAASGDLRWIDNMDVIDSLAEAYEALEVVNILAVKWLESIDDTDQQYALSNGSPSINSSKQLAADAASDACTVVANALNKLGLELASPASAPQRQGTAKVA